MNRKNLSLAVLVFIFIIPGIAAIVAYKYPNILSLSTTNNGEFVKPPLLLSDLNNRNKWRLVYSNSGSCDEHCMGNVDKMARIRLALGRRLYNVESVLLLPSFAQNLQEEQEKILEDINVSVVKLPPDSKDYKHFFVNEHGFYIVSPENYMVLKYTADASSEDIFQDLKKLVTD